MSRGGGEVPCAVRLSPGRSSICETNFQLRNANGGISEDPDLIRPDLDYVPFFAGKLIRGNNAGAGEEHGHRGDVVRPAKVGHELSNRPADPGSANLAPKDFTPLALDAAPKSEAPFHRLV